MIATHNSMSYLPFESFWYALKGKRYRCQNKTIDEQIEDGVKYFDIRIKRDKELSTSTNDIWKFAHSGANFEYPVEYDNDGKTIRELSLYQVLNKIEKANCFFRLVYEGSNKGDETRFRLEVRTIMRVFPKALDQVVIKNGWQELRKSRFKFVDRSYVPIYSDKNASWWTRFKHKFADIKDWAFDHNEPLTQDEIKDEKVVYFYDFYNFQLY